VVRVRQATESVATFGTAGRRSKLGFITRADPTGSRDNGWRTLSGVAFSSAMPPDEPVPSCATRCVTAMPPGSTTARPRPDWLTLSAGRLRSKSLSLPQRGEIPRRGELSLAEWAHVWLPTRLDLRPTTWARLETTMQKQVLPHFGSAPLNRITNVSTLLNSGLSAATTRKLFSLCGNAWLLRLLTSAFRSIPRAQCPFPLSAKSLRSIYRKARSSASSTRCLLITVPSCWSAHTPGLAGEKLQGCAGATSA
jgi:hypothetical protein